MCPWDKMLRRRFSPGYIWFLRSMNNLAYKCSFGSRENLYLVKHCGKINSTSFPCHSHKKMIGFKLEWEELSVIRKELYISSHRLVQMTDTRLKLLKLCIVPNSQEDKRSSSQRNWDSPRTTLMSMRIFVMIRSHKRLWTKVKRIHQNVVCSIGYEPRAIPEWFNRKTSDC